MHEIYSPGSLDRDHLRRSANGDNIIADVKVLPGESGSPLIDVLPVGHHVRDLLGQQLNTRLPNKSGFAPIVLGHATLYHRNFDISHFLAPKSAQDLVQRWLKGERGNIGQTTWKKIDGMFVRQSLDKQGKVSLEINDKSKAGDGTKANGGDGTKANGGDGTKANGGKNDQPSAGSSMGMIYQDQEVYAFRVKEKSRSGEIPSTVSARKIEMS